MEFDQFAGEYEKILDQSLAFSGEDSSYFADYKAAYLARVLPKPFAGRILDFGCGVGMLAQSLKKHLPSARLDGYDVSPESIRRVDAGLTAGGAFTSDLKSLEPGYDLIVTANVMHHIEPGERQQTIFNLSDLLSPSGKLAVFEHNPANPATRWMVERCPFDKDVVLLPPKETLAYFGAARLDILRHDYIVFMPRFLAWFRPMEPWLAWLPLGAQYAVLGGKRA